MVDQSQVIRGAIGIVIRADTVLICRRRTGTRFGGCWEFPGGKIEPDESPQQCLHRELWEELRIRVTPLTALDPIEHDYSYGRIQLWPFVCRHESGEPQPIGCEQAIWIEPMRLREYQFPPANEPLIERVIQILAVAPPPAAGS